MNPAAPAFTATAAPPAGSRPGPWLLLGLAGLALGGAMWTRPDGFVFVGAVVVGVLLDLAMRDTPGLCAPEVTALRKAGIRSMAGLIDSLRPEWTVRRASEYAAFSPQEVAAFDREFELWILYDARPEIGRIGWLPGRDFLLFDAQYGLWRRRRAVGGPP